MKQFFYPQSVAVVGVSEYPTNLGRVIVNNLLDFGFQGPIFPIGPRGGQVHGLEILPSLMELPQPVDLVTVLAPALVVPKVLDHCAQRGITRVVVESGGFSECSEAGKVLEEEVRQRLQDYGIRMVGPNGLGLINLEVGLCLPFAQIPLRPRLGGVSVVAQSGGVGANLISWLAQEGLGMNKFISLGNKLNINENDILAYLLEDDGTQVIYLYLEDIADGRRLMDLGQAATKPILLHKGNIGQASAAIARSHTAALTVDDRVVDAACFQAGLCRVHTQADFLLAAKALEQPPLQGNRLAVMSRSGGQAVLVADACQRWGFELPPLSERIQNLIRSRSRAGIIEPLNPVDLGDVYDFSLYRDLMHEFCRDPVFDAVLLNYEPLSDEEKAVARDTVKDLVRLAQRHQKPLVIAVIGELEEEQYLRQELGVPVFDFPEEAIQGLALARQASTTPTALTASMATPPQLPEVEKVLGPHLNTPGPLPMPVALEVFQSLGMAVPEWHLVTSGEEAQSAASRLGCPVCLKMVAASAVHKSDLGGVLLNLETVAAAVQGFDQLAQVAQKRLPPGEEWQALIMPMVAGGVEVLFGARRDHTFGPLVVFGAGGIWVEILEDVALGIAPLDQEQARRLIDQTRISALLEGRRGQPAADRESLIQGIMLLSSLMLHFPQIQELDLNPIRVFPQGQGLLILDARMTIG
ncbi:MAG: acetate--CoA ligase family protein [Desulfobacteraceae bacterium]